MLAICREAAARRVPVTTWEGAIGHALAGTGILGLVFAASTLRRVEVLPVASAGRLDPECRLRYVLDEPLALASPSVLVLTVGFGGQNGATLVTSPELAADLFARKPVLR